MADALVRTESVPQITREELERIPLSPELHKVRTELLFRTESVWTEFQAQTDSLMAEWQEFGAAVERFREGAGSVQ